MWNKEIIWRKHSSLRCVFVRVLTVLLTIIIELC